MFVFEFQGERRSKTGAKINDFSCETHRRCRTLQNGKSNCRLLYVIKTLKLPDNVKFCLSSQQSFAHCISKIRQDLSFPTLASKKISRPSDGGGGGGAGVCPKKKLLNFWIPI